MRWRSRRHGRGAAATAVLCALVGAAVVLHQQTGPSHTGQRGAKKQAGHSGGGTPQGPHAGHIMPAAVPVAVPTAAPLPRTGWTVTADNAQADAARVLDGDPGTVWRTDAVALPHFLVIDTHNRVALSGLTYLP